MLRPRVRLTCLALVLTVLSAGCDAPPAPEEGRAPSARSEARPPACPNQQRALREDRAPRSRRLRADVDGDGSTDRVWLTVARRGPTGCQGFVAAEAGEEAESRTLVAPLVEFDARDRRLGFPRLGGALTIDAREGAEVVVEVAAGASTVFAAVFTVTDGELVRVDARGPGAPARDLFAYGGGVTHAYGVDCDGDGAVVVTEAIARGSRYVVERAFLRTNGAAWAVERRRRTVLPARRLLARFPELGAPPFLGCPPA